jgi:cytochrome c553
MLDRMGGNASRRWLVAALLAGVAACGSPKAPDPPAEPKPVAFEGGEAAGIAARIAHGRRLARVLGCAGCHGRDLQGKPFYEFHASNLTRDAAKYDDAQLERLLREGRRIDGRELWAMPSEIFQHLSGPDMAALIAFLRSLAPAGRPTPPLPPFGAKLRAEVKAGKVRPAAEWVKLFRARTPADLGPSHALGRYIAMVTCAECHNARLEGHEGDTPDLVVAGPYSRAEFEALIRKGVPNGPRKLGLMADVAQGRFSQLTASEVDALYAYLRVRAERAE